MSQLLDLELTQTARLASLKFSWLGFIIFAISLLLLGFTWQAYQHLQHSYADITLSLTQQEKPPVLVASAETVAIAPNELKQVTTLVDSLATPWNPLMLAIEQSDMPDIALLSVEPSSKKQQVLLTGEAKNLQIVLGYIEQLEAQPMLREVYLQKHSIDETNISKPVSFTVLAKWKAIP